MLEKYLDDLLDLRNENTDALFFEQKKEERPIVHRSVAIFIKQIVSMKNPKRILEIGMNAGYSAICFAEGMNEDSKLDCIEYREDHIKIAKQNFRRYNVLDKINVIQGRAEELLVDKLKEIFYDIIFIDADKKGYPLYLDYAQKHLNNKGIILVDNLLWKGNIYSEDNWIKTKPSTITIKAFNESFMKMDEFISQVLPIGDGLGYAVKI